MRFLGPKRHGSLDAPRAREARLFPDAGSQFSVNREQDTLALVPRKSSIHILYGAVFFHRAAKPPKVKSLP